MAANVTVFLRFTVNFFLLLEGKPSLVEEGEGGEYSARFKAPNMTLLSEALAEGCRQRRSQQHLLTSSPLQHLDAEINAGHKPPITPV